MPQGDLLTSACRRALWIVVALNLGYGVIEMIGGVLADSQALKADALDFLGDGAITFLGLLALGRPRLWRALRDDPGASSWDARFERHRHDSVPGPGPVWLFSRNDAIGNAAVVFSAGLVAWIGTAWPDLVVAIIIASLFLQSSWSIVHDARKDLAHEVN